MTAWIPLAVIAVVGLTLLYFVSQIPHAQAQSTRRTYRYENYEDEPYEGKNRIGICAICLDNKISCRFQPCGHCSCGECGRKMTSKNCHVCRKPIKSLERIYI